MNWGKGLALTLIAFAGLMAWFVVKAAQNPEPLVTEQYYERELEYQDRINNTARAQALSAPVEMTITAKSMHLTFPKELRDKSIRGELTLLRPNDPLADRTLTVHADSSGVYSAAIELVSGRYNALLEWNADDVAYYTEEKLIVP